MRNSQKRKQSPLSVWRAQYNYISKRIRETKDAVKIGNRSKAALPFNSDLTLAQNIRAQRRYAVSKNTAKFQRNVLFLKGEATRLMGEREVAHTAARELWRSNQRGSV